MENVMMKAVRKMLREHRLAFHEEEEKGAIYVGFDGMTIVFKGSEDDMVVRLFIDHEVPEWNVPEVVMFLNRINCITVRGHAEYDEDIKNVLFRVRTESVTDEEEAKKRVFELLASAVSFAGTFKRGLMNVIEGIDTAEDAFGKSVAQLRAKDGE